MEKENQAHSSFTLGASTLGNPQNKTHIIVNHGNHISESFKRKVSRPPKRSVYPESERERSSSRVERHRNEEVYQVSRAS